MSRKSMLRELREKSFSDAGMSIEEFTAIAARHGYPNIRVSTMEKLFIFRNDNVIPRGWYFRTCEKMFLGITQVGRHSFGIEFEGGVMRANDGKVCTGMRSVYAHIGKWGVQMDPTAGFEIWTPIIVNPDDGVKQIGDQWKHWVSENPGYLPYWRSNRLHSSMGHHVHIGKPSRSLALDEKKRIAASAIRILSGIYFISANHPYKYDNEMRLSKRLATSGFCKTVEQLIHHGEHRWEIEDSHIGTVEFRGIECNYPQITSTCAMLLQFAADKSKDFTTYNERELVSKHRNLKTEILKNKILAYLEARKSMGEVLGDYEPKYQFQKEILYLALVLAENPALFIGKMNPENVKNLITNPEKFFENIKSKKNAKILDAFAEDVEKFKTIGDMCKVKVKLYSKARLHGVWTRIKRETSSESKAKEILDANFDYRGDWFSEIKDKKIKQREKPKRFMIRRYYEIGSIDSARAIEEMVRMDSSLSDEMIRESNDRFYVGVYGDEIIGFAQINYVHHLIKKIVGVNPQMQERMNALVESKFENFTRESESLNNFGAGRE